MGEAKRRKLAGLPPQQTKPETMQSTQPGPSLSQRTLALSTHADAHVRGAPPVPAQTPCADPHCDCPR
jgi:hypothetical protein